MEMVEEGELEMELPINQVTDISGDSRTRKLRVDNHNRSEHLTTDILIVTVTKVESQAVLSWVQNTLGRKVKKHYHANKTYYDLGIIGGVTVFMVRSEMGAGGPGGAALTISEAVNILSPTAIIMVGIAFGVNPDKQPIGTILVSKQLMSYDLQRVSTKADGGLRVIPRGDRVSASPMLLDRFRSGELSWNDSDTQFGVVLSGAKLVDNIDYREQLLQIEPEAIGGEMEGSGLYDVAHRHKVDWILIKAVCDWADGNKGKNKNKYQQIAADNAVGFTFHVIDQGAFQELNKESSNDEVKISSATAYSFQNQFQSLIDEATTDFVGREYVFREIDAFLANQSKGYLTIEGDPGMGKTAILAKYVQQNDCVAYFNERLVGRNRAAQFLESVCTQLVSRYNLPYTSLPPKATEDGSFLLQLLDEISPRLGPANRLVIAIDALDEVDLTVHTSGTNILYLPERLPDHVYFVMTRRRMDFLPLRMRVPQQLLNLLDYHNDSQRDVQTYIRQAAEDEARQQLRAWIARQAIETDEFVASLAAKSEDNFMYLYHVLWALNYGELYHDRNLDSLPLGLQGYYQDHWRHIRGRSGDEIWFKYKLPVIVALTVVKKPVSIELIEHFSKVRERARIHTVLNEWSQFLRQVDVGYEDGLRKCYRLYHASFHDFVASLEEVEDERVNLKQMHGQIADTLWDELFGDE